MTPLKLLILAATIPAATIASSNTVSITHTSYTNNYSNDQVNVIRSHPQEEPEYVTGFYKRVKDKRREMFGRQLQQHDVIQEKKNLDHSLDHYFDQPSQRHHRSSDIKKKDKAIPVATVAPTATASTEVKLSRARCVRGGGVGTATSTSKLMARHSPAASASASGSHHQSDVSASRSHGHGHHRQSRSRAGQLHGHGHGHSHRNAQSSSHQYRPPPKPYARLEDYDTIEEEDEGDVEDCPEHHLGLLRVPCSIAINSGEANLGHSHHSHHHDSMTRHRGCSQTKTTMAAYVDTGAQVTIISASAAKRAGIYHLIDRRYAGRATGVGHCKVLGRIPARHVYFNLGEGCDDEEDYDSEDEYYEDCRGGGGDQDYYQEEEQENSSNMVQMDGPALTVLEGTVTQGVDILFGLDVLQDWEAEIRMGPKKSITVNKRRSRSSGRGSGTSSSVVIPFASSSRGYSRRKSQGQRRRNVLPLANKATSSTAHASHPSRSSRAAAPAHSGFSVNHHHRRNNKPEPSISQHDVFNIDDYDDDEDFSPNVSDIESDLDLLDQSGHKFPEESVHNILDSMENELMMDNGMNMDSVVNDEEEESYDGDDTSDDDDDEEDDSDVDYGEDEEMIDMSGL